MNDLTKIGQKHGTDKSTINGYTHVYNELFKNFKEDRVNLWEIGAGDKGASHKMWKDYFVHGSIFCMDTFHSPLQNKLKEDLEQYGVKTYKGNQLSRIDIKNCLDSFNTVFHYVVDDGAHMPDAIQLSLGMIFPFIVSGGQYIVEDLLCAKKRQNKIQDTRCKCKSKRVRTFITASSRLQYRR